MLILFNIYLVKVKVFDFSVSENDTFYGTEGVYP
jgi:hypothetical protein